MKKLLLLSLILNSVVAIAQYRRGGFDRHSRHTRYGGLSSEIQLTLNIDKILVGEQVIKLKKELKKQHPSLDLQSMQLKSLKVIAKAGPRRGGELFLSAGQVTSPVQKIGGSPYEFHSEKPYTYDRIHVLNPSLGNEGKWLLVSKGKIKMKQIFVSLTKKKVKKIKEIIIPMYGKLSKGLEVLALKKLIKSQNPNLDLQDIELKKVTLVAKSKLGKAQATLMVGQSPSYPQTIHGSPRGFESSAPRTFSSLSMINTTGSSQGKWIVELQGVVKVKELIITVKKQNNGHVSAPITRTPVVQTPPATQNQGGRGSGRENNNREGRRS